MSRIGRQPITVPTNVTVTVDETNFVSVKGPKGELTRQFPPSIALNLTPGEETTVGFPAYGSLASLACDLHSFDHVR